MLDENEVPYAVGHPGVILFGEIHPMGLQIFYWELMSSILGSDTFALIFLTASCAFLPSSIAAQSLQFLPEEDRPPVVPLILLMGLTDKGTLATDPTVPPNGSPTEATVEELRTRNGPAGPAGSVASSRTIKYGDRGQIMEEVAKDGFSETDTVTRYDRSRLVSREVTFLKSNYPRPKFWEHWTYDQSGRLSEYQRGSGDTLQNHLANFKRDTTGQLIGYEYRQGAKDELFSHEEIQYGPDGKTVAIASRNQAGVAMSEVTETLDSQRRVVGYEFAAPSAPRNATGSPIKVAFKYDDKSRLIEQVTDDYDVEKFAEEVGLPPGKVAVGYDDVNRAKTTTYSGLGGSFSTSITSDAAGGSVDVITVINGMTHLLKLTCSYDTHDNWTDCSQTSGPGTPIEKAWRRTIVSR